VTSLYLVKGSSVDLGKKGVRTQASLNGVRARVEWPAQGREKFWLVILKIGDFLLRDKPSFEKTD